MTTGVLVAGGGIAGASVGIALRDRDVDVLVVEREKPGGRATGASAGMLTAQYEAEAPGPALRFSVCCRETQAAFVARLEELAGTSLHHRVDGMLVASFSEEEHRHARRTAEWQRREGLRARLLEPGRAAERQGGLSGEARSYLWLPDEAQVDTQRLAGALPAALSAAGVHLVEGATVQEVLCGPGSVRGVRLSDGSTLEADRVVVAAGAWSARIRGLPRELPVRPVRGQLIRYPAGVASLGVLLARRDGRYLVPRADGTVLAGSTMERDAGFDAAVTDEGTGFIRDGAASLLPELARAEPSERWAGLRPVTPDGQPVIGPDPDVEGLFYATGYGRNGILYAPGGARVVADLITRGHTGLPWEPFRVDRFAAEPGGDGEREVRARP